MVLRDMSGRITLAAVALLFTEHVPALVCFACTAALAMFWCWELEHHAAS